MAASSSPLAVACPKCGERLGVRAEDVGKRGKCRRCGAVFRIGMEGGEGDAKPQAGDRVGFNRRGSA